MPRKGENIYRRKDGRWEGRFIIFRTAEGTAKYKSIYGKTYMEVKKKMRKEKEDYIYPMQKKESEPYNKTKNISEISEEYLKYKKNIIKESSYVKYSNMIEQYIKPYLGNLRIDHVDYGQIEEFGRKLCLTGGKKGQSLSAKTVSDTLALFKNILGYAKKRYGILTCDLRGICFHKSETQIQVLSKPEHEMLTAYLYTHKNLKNTGILLALFTGVRIGELCALKWKNIRLDLKSIYICQTMQRLQNKEKNDSDAKTHITITSPKSQCSVREIPLPDFLVEYLSPYLSQENHFFLTGSSEKFIEPRTLQNYFKKVLKEVGIQPVNFHILRHTFATRCIELGFDIKSLSEVLGHANVNITLNRYVHPSMEKKRDNMEKLASLITVKKSVRD